MKVKGFQLGMIAQTKQQLQCSLLERMHPAEMKTTQTNKFRSKRAGKDKKKEAKKVRSQKGAAQQVDRKKNFPFDNGHCGEGLAAIGWMASFTFAIKF